MNLRPNKKAIILLRVRKINKIRKKYFCASFIVRSYHVKAFIKSFKAKGKNIKFCTEVIGIDGMERIFGPKI